jgi:Family of unknown function (DUF6527)
MPKQTSFAPKFVELIPDMLEEGILYISVRYKSACHLCVCGCGTKVVTPLSPTGWQMTYDGRTVSLHPSIGNWNLACQSHYWITHNQVRWAPRWSPGEIEEGFAHDKQLKENYYKKPQIPSKTVNGLPDDTRDRDGFWRKLGRRLSRR